MDIIEGILGFISFTTVAGAIGVLVIIGLFFMAVTKVLRLIKKVPPNRAYIVFGVRTRSKVTILKRIPKEETIEPTSLEDYESRFTTVPETVEVNFKIVKGGSTIVLPIVHEVRELDLGLMTLDVEVRNVLSTQAVPITVDGIAQIKIGSDDPSIATAAEQLLGKDTAQIMHVARETLMGHLRAIIGLMTVEQVYKDREAFAQKVMEVAVDDLQGMGLEIVSFTIKEINDEKGYLDALGQPEIVAKLRDARKATATADQEAVEKEQEAVKKKAEYSKEANVAQAQYQAETDRQRAIADMARGISESEQTKILEERKTEAAKVAAVRRDRELDAEERRPADARLYAAEKDAEGVRATGFADADVDQRKGEAEAAANKAKGLAGAEVTKAEGEAEGAAILAKLMGEAEGQRKLGASLNAYQDSALRLVLGQALLSKIPEVAASFGEAFANIEQIRLIELGGAEGEGALDRFLDTLPNTLFKFLQGATALLAGPIDDLVAAWIVEEAGKRGVEIPPEEQEAVRKKVAEKMAEAEAEAEEKAEALPPPEKPERGLRKKKK
jgi:flotillin